MWTLAKLFIAGAIALFWLQNATPNPVAPANAASTPSKAPAATAATVAASQGVITVHGVCEESKEKTESGASSCATVITREQFEKLMQALHPGEDLPANARNNLAKLYAEYLTIEAATRKADMEDTPEFGVFMHWMKALAATEYYRRKLQQKYSNPPKEEIDAYYHAHLAEYESAKVARVMIPRENHLAADKDEFEKKALAAANTAQVSLATGLDPAEVQKSAYSALGLQGSPAVDIGSRRRRDFIAEEAAEIFSLKAGEVTKVEIEPKSYVIYKVLSRETASEESLNKQISGQLTEQKFRATMKSLVDSAQVDLNEQYFGPSSAVDTEPPRSPHTIVSH